MHEGRMGGLQSARRSRRRNKKKKEREEKEKKEGFDFSRLFQYNLEEIKRDRLGDENDKEDNKLI